MNKDMFKSMCNGYTDDEVCNACCNNLVMEKQACYKPPVKAVRAVQNKVGNSMNGDGKRYCRAVQTLCEHCPFERECEKNEK